MNKILILLFVLLNTTIRLHAQLTAKDPFTISGYVEVYYQQDFNNPKSNTRPGFVYSHNRLNEVSLNLGMLHAAYRIEGVRANLGLGVGSYMSANYIAEQDVFKNIYEANVGVKLSKSKNIWLDAGILPSHIGMESAVGIDCFTLTRSMMADNSPYFETGARVSYVTENDKWNIALLLLNGWQRIQRVEGSNLPAFGHQVTFRPSDRVTLNSSSYIGNDSPEDTRAMRYFHDLYGQFELSSKIAIIAGLDMGAQQKEKSGSAYDTWYTGALIIKYRHNQKLRIAARGEYFDDSRGVLISLGEKNRCQMISTSLNIDYEILSNLLWRTEIKYLNSKDAVFLDTEVAIKKSNPLAITALAIRF